MPACAAARSVLGLRPDAGAPRAFDHPAGEFQHARIARVHFFSVSRRRTQGLFQTRRWREKLDGVEHRAVEVLIRALDWFSSSLYCPAKLRACPLDDSRINPVQLPPGFPRGLRRKCRTRPGMSARRSRIGGTTIGTVRRYTGRAKNRRRRPAVQILLCFDHPTAVRRLRVPPTRSNRRLAIRSTVGLV